MKKGKKGLFQSILLVLLGLLVLLSMVPFQPREPETLEISVLFLQRDSGLWDNIRLGMEQAAADQGAELRFLSVSYDGEETDGAQLLLREAADGTDAVIIAPAIEQELEPILEEASANCPILTFSQGMDHTLLDFSPGGEEVSRMLINMALEDGREGTFLLLSESGTGLDDQRVIFAESYLRQQGIEPVRLSVRQNESRRLARTLETMDPDCVICPEAGLTYALCQHWMKEQESAPDYRFYGMGVTEPAARCLESGVIRGLVGCSDYASGYLICESAALAARGKEIEWEGELPLYAIGKEELDERSYQKLFFPVLP